MTLDSDVGWQQASGLGCCELMDSSQGCWGVCPGSLVRAGPNHGSIVMSLNEAAWPGRATWLSLPLSASVF